MAHVRKQIRDAIAARVTGLTTTASRVFVSRVYEPGSGELPCLLVYATDEESGSDTMGTLGGARKISRELSVVIAAFAAVNETLDDTLDTICAEVETVLGLDAALGGLAKDLWLASTSIGLTKGETQLGTAVLTFRAMYRTAIELPHQAL